MRTIYIQYIYIYVLYIYIYAVSFDLICPFHTQHPGSYSQTNVCGTTAYVFPFCSAKSLPHDPFFKLCTVKSHISLSLHKFHCVTSLTGQDPQVAGRGAAGKFNEKSVGDKDTKEMYRSKTPATCAKQSEMYLNVLNSSIDINRLRAFCAPPV